MTESASNVDAAANHDENVKLLNTSAYDSITEVISHGIRHFQTVDELFTAKVNKKPHSSFSFCYPTALFNYAKTGPCNEAYKLRADILSEISTKRPITCAHELLEELNICQEGCRDGCKTRSLNLFELSRDKYVWKDYYMLQTMLDRYFARNTKQCDACKRNYFVAGGPLLCINVEIFYEFFYVTGRSHKEQIFHSKMVRTSLDELPDRLVVQGSYYELCGVVERIPGSKDEEHHYVAYCRDPGGKWERRDGFEGEKKEFTEWSINSIALVLYASLGHWDKDERKWMLEPAKPAWNKLTDIYLPDICLDKILSFLDNRQLKVLIQAGLEGEKSDRDFTFLLEDTEEDEVSIFAFACRSNEHFDQWRCLHNVIIYNLPLADDVSDLESVKKLFDGICGLDLDNIRVRRSNTLLGTGEPPLTIVTFQSLSQVKNIMMSKKSFPKGIKIGRDYTKWQRNRYKKLSAIAEKHNITNPNAQKIVIYIDGTPTLVNKKKNYYRNTKNGSKQ